MLNSIRLKLATQLYVEFERHRNLNYHSTGWIDLEMISLLSWLRRIKGLTEAIFEHLILLITMRLLSQALQDPSVFTLPMHLRRN